MKGNLQTFQNGNIVVISFYHMCKSVSFQRSRIAAVIERWKITAFLQPETNLSKYENGTDKPLEYYGITLRISEMYFIPLENPNKPTDLGIKVLLKNYIVHKENPRLREAVYVHIEHLIGEKSFANYIAFIEIGQLEGDNENKIELYQIEKHFLKAKKSGLNSLLLEFVIFIECLNK